MKIAPKPTNELERLSELKKYNILDTEAEAEYDDFTSLAAYICKTPIALISLIDNDRQWFKSKVGLDASQTSRDFAFCAHAIMDDDVFIINDSALDDRFNDNPLVTGNLNVKYYAGAPLITPNGHRIGTLCVIDNTPRSLDDEQIKCLKALSRQVIQLLEIRNLNNEIKEKSKIAEAALKAKSIFLANISHEIRTPLNGIIGMSQLLKANITDPKKTVQIDAILSCGSSLVDIIDDILIFSKLEENKIEIHNSSFDLNIAVNETIQLFQDKLKEKNLKIIQNTKTNIPNLVLMDKNKIKQILTNLISNAIKFSCDGHIELITSAQDLKNKRWLYEFSVKDSGIGISPELINQLFIPFSQVDSSAARRNSGSGLGLAICKSLCEKMGGKIWVNSKVNEGTTFTFQIVMDQNDSKIHSETDFDLLRSVQNLAQDFPLSILIVDDNRINRLVASGILEKLGYESHQAQNGLEALEQIANNNYDLILMDCHMPVMDGLEATQSIRKKYDVMDRPRIVGVSASTMPEDIDLCMKSGMDSFFGKPIHIPDLITELKSCYNQKTNIQRKKAS